MELAKKLFGKEITEINKSDILEYFSSPHEESDILEYKSYPPEGKFEHKKKDILRAISGMLNSEGGILVWGAPKEKKDGGKKLYGGELSPVTKNLEKDDFMASILNRIIPAPNGVKMVKITVGPDEYVYVFEIPKSTTRPHQFDHRYYMRADGQTIPAPHHYIEALFKQISYPNLTGSVELWPITPNNPKQLLVGLEFIVNVQIENLSFCQNEKNLELSLVVADSPVEFQAAPPLNLHYGKPFYFTTKIALYEEEFLNPRIRLLFGGEKSPLRISEYELIQDDKTAPNDQEGTHWILKPVRLNEFLFEAP